MSATRAGKFGNRFAIALLATLAFSLAAFAQASDVYVTPDGSPQGACTSNPQPPAFFNNSANWGKAANKIGPGTTVHLCGTFVAAAGGNILTVQGSGAGGQPIKVLFEAGSIMTAPYWSASGAISANGQSYLTIDGGSNGTITATANGTGMAHQAGGVGVYFSSVSNSEIKNLTISNIYVHTCIAPDNPNCTDEGGTQTNWGIYWLGGSNATIDHNTIHDAYGCIEYIYPGSTTTSNLDFHHNTASNCNWDISIGSGGTNAIINGALIHDNVMHDWSNWGDANNQNHHDGIFVFTAASGQQINGLQIYNNRLYGNLEAISGYIYIEDDNAGRPISNAYVFNNVIYNTSSAVSVFAPIYDWSTGAFVFNNTIVGPQDGPNGGNAYLLYGTGSTLRNNIFMTCSNALVVNTTASIASSDYNAFYGCQNVAVYQGTYASTLVSWQKHTGIPDAHGVNSNPLLNPNSTPPYQLSGTSSPAYQAGVNLSQYCGVAPALCTDASGNPRPTGGAWDIGAYQLSSGTKAGNPTAPSGLIADIN
jgi:hypothetical protein